MAETTGISWCDHTQNFWIGCTAVSPACAHCYAEKLVEGRMGRVFSERRRTVPDNWRKPFVWDRKAREAGVRRRVFTLSLGDFWDNQADPAWRLEALDVIRQTPNLDWLILTKRPMNIRGILAEAYTEARKSSQWPLADWLQAWLGGYLAPLNVWLGTTVENQEEADRRIPHLLAVPARVRFLSCEPLLGPVDLRQVRQYNPKGEPWIDALQGIVTRGGYLARSPSECCINTSTQVSPPELPRIDWVICGGESGPGARPMNPHWARSLRNQCAAAAVPFFFKQWGEYAPAPDGADTYAAHRARSGKDYVVWLDMGASEYVGTKRAGDHLDGRQHHAWPA